MPTLEIQSRLIGRDNEERSKNSAMPVVSLDQCPWKSRSLGQDSVIRSTCCDFRSQRRARMGSRVHGSQTR